MKIERLLGSILFIAIFFVMVNYIIGGYNQKMEEAVKDNVWTFKVQEMKISNEEIVLKYTGNCAGGLFSSDSLCLKTFTFPKEFMQGDYPTIGSRCHFERKGASYERNGIIGIQQEGERRVWCDA